jgi:hypothetical protein
LWREDTTFDLAPDAASDQSIPIASPVAERMTRDADKPLGPWYPAPMGDGGGYVMVYYDVVLLPKKTKG